MAVREAQVSLFSLAQGLSLGVLGKDETSVSVPTWPPPATKWAWFGSTGINSAAIDVLPASKASN